MGWAQKQQNTSCSCLFKDTAKLLLHVFSKGFYKNNQWRCGTLLEVYISDDLVDVKTMFLSAHLECVTSKVLLLQMLLGGLVKTGIGRVRTDGNGNLLVTLTRSAVVARSTSALKVALNSATILNK